jgi:hypothetical protein
MSNNTKDTIKKYWDKIPFGQYFRRYWYIVLIACAIVYAYGQTALGTMLRGAIMVPMFAFIAVCTSLLARNFLNKSTTDPYVDNKEQLKIHFEGLTPYEKIKITKDEFGQYFIGACILGTGLLITYGG